MRSRAFTKSYSGHMVLSLPELEFAPGKIYAVLGANGAGKSTMIRILAGMERADSGRLSFTGVSIGYLPQKAFSFYMSTYRNILSNSARDEDACQRADELIRRILLENVRDQNAKSLSGGETARMALCRLLMQDYDVLLLDEPTAAMDMESTVLAERLICEYKERTGCTVLLITHSIAQALRTSDELLYLEHGMLTACGPTKDLLNAPPKAFEAFLEFTQGT